MNVDYMNPPMSAIGSVVNGLAGDIHDNAVKHGFYADYEELQMHLGINDQPWFAEVTKMNFILAQLAKIASEAGEAVAAVQHGNTSELFEELADVAIRTLDLGAFLTPRFGDVIMAKHEHNRSRPYKHGKRC